MIMEVHHPHTTTAKKLESLFLGVPNVVLK
jgi:hypothetical protein